MVQPPRWKDRPHADQRFAVYYFVNSCRHPYLKSSLKPKFEVYRPVTVQVTIFWDVMPCSTGVPKAPALFIIWVVCMLKRFIWNILTQLPDYTASISSRVFFRSRSYTNTFQAHSGATEYEHVWSCVEESLKQRRHIVVSVLHSIRPELAEWRTLVQCCLVPVRSHTLLCMCCGKGGNENALSFLHSVT